MLLLQHGKLLGRFIGQTSSYHKAVVRGVGRERHAQPHLVLSLRYVGERYPSLRGEKNKSHCRELGSTLQRPG